MRVDSLVAAVSGLLGAIGIGLLALAAHGTWPSLDYAAIMALAHAVALLAIAAAARLEVVDPTIARLAALDLAIGVVLFCGDIAMRAFTGDRLFPMAAPIGGLLCISGWLLLTASALIAARRG